MWELAGWVIFLLVLVAAGNRIENRFDELEIKLGDIKDQLDELMPQNRNDRPLDEN